MANEFNRKYNIADGDTKMIVHKNGTGKNPTVVSVQLITDATFDGNNTKAKLLQSNDPELDVDLWNELPENPITLNTGAGSALLQTLSFTCGYLAVSIEAGNATTGVITIIEQYNG